MIFAEPNLLSTAFYRDMEHADHLQAPRESTASSKTGPEGQFRVEARHLTHRTSRPPQYLGRVNHTGNAMCGPGISTAAGLGRRFVGARYEQPVVA